MSANGDDKPCQTRSSPLALPTRVDSVEGGIHHECLDAHLGQTLPGAVDVVRVGTVAESPVGGALAAVKVERRGGRPNVECRGAEASTADELRLVERSGPHLVTLVVENAGHHGFLITIGSHAWCARLDRDGERARCSERSSVLCGVGHRDLRTDWKLALIDGCGSSWYAECNGRCGCQAGSDLDKHDDLSMCRTYGNLRKSYRFSVEV